MRGGGKTDGVLGKWALKERRYGSAFNAIMDRYEKPVLNMIYRYLQDYDGAQDLMQETFLRVYKARERYEVRSKFSTWLFQIAVNLCLNERRFRSRIQENSCRIASPISLDSRRR